MILAYDHMLQVAHGSMVRFLGMCEAADWPIPRNTIMDEFEGIKRSIFDSLSDLCLGTTWVNSSSGSTVN